MEALIKASINYFTLEGERIQNCQNEDEALDVTFSAAKIKDKLTVTWELKPIAPRKEYGVNAAKAQHKSPMRLVVLLDVSCSMEEPYGPDGISKLDKIKMFIKLLADNMSEEDDLGLVTFGTSSEVVLSLTRMDLDGKEAACLAVEDIRLGGVTNLGAGLCTSVEQFRNIYSKSAEGERVTKAPPLLEMLEHPAEHWPGYWGMVLGNESPKRDIKMFRPPKKEENKIRYQNDNILLFTDGMANEGMTETEDMVRELRKRITSIRKECQFAEDYTIKLSTLGTGGFLPELLFNVGQAFSSDAFYFLEENTNLELNLIKPVLLRQYAMVSAVSVKLVMLNGVTLDKQQMTNEYEPYDPDAEELCDITKADYFIHDIASDMRRHLYCVLQLPSKHKRALKNKDVMTLQVRYRDKNLLVRTVEKTVSYLDLPLKEIRTEEKDLIIAAEQHCRTAAQKTLDSAAESMKCLKRAEAREKITYGAHIIREFCEHVGTLVCEETLEYLLHQVEPILVNLEHTERHLADLCVRWDDAWGRLKAMSSSLGREVPTAGGVYSDGGELFVPPKVDEHLEDLVSRLRDMYLALGLSTETIDSYKTVMRELQDKLDKLEEEGTDFKESRI